MEKIIFAYASSASDPEASILAASIRKFAGTLSDSPIWIFIPDSGRKMPKRIEEHLISLDVQIIPFKVEDDSKFPFARFVLAAATAESLVKGKTKLLVWLGANTIVFNDPKLFLLRENINLGYRPVHHTLIGSFYEKPMDPFWELVYRKCNVPEDRIFPMQTHVDHNTLRPYFNAGFLIVRPEKGLLKAWWEKYRELYHDTSFKEFYEKDELYIIFIHQAVLSGVILSTMERKELQELPFMYNYPLNLYFECPIALRPSNVNDLITARFEGFEEEVPKWLEKIPLQDPLKSWLTDQLNSLTQLKVSSSKKVKFGKVPLIYPIPIILAGALVKGKPNFETLGDVGIMGIKPPIVYISSGQDHYTNQGILENGTFSINFPPTKLLTITDYCGTVSGHDVDKSQLFNVFFGELETAPMIQECPVNIECKVIKEFSIQHRQIFIGDVVQSYVNEDFLIESEGRQRIVDMKLLDPIIYALDNCYYSIGKRIGVGYQESKKFQKQK